MSERHLRAMNPQTGEVCAECVALRDEVLSLTRVLSSKDRTISELNNKAVKLQAVVPGADDIIEVLVYCRESWGKRWGIVPGKGKRWEKVSERLEEHLLDRGPFTKAELKLAADGAKLDPWINGTDRKSKGYLKVETVFRDFEQVERFLDLTVEFEARTGMPLQDFPPELLTVDLKFLCRRCDCGCLRMEHFVPDPRTGYQGCRRCPDCVDFYDGEELLREIEARHKENPS